jgi:hypothetical protein
MRARASIGATLAAAAIAVGAITIQSGAAAQEGNPSASDPANDPMTNTETTKSTKTVTTTATIDKVDKEGGLVTLRANNGTTVDVKPGPDVHMDQLKVGDKVNATYFSETAVGISKPGQGQPKSTQTTVQRGGVTARQATMTAQILSVDQRTNTVLIRGPQGKTHAIMVQDPAVQAKLGRIKPGDNVDITYTQAVATSLEPIK